MGELRTRLRRLLASVRLRMLVSQVLLLSAALVSTILITRYVQLAQADREIEIEQAQEVEELRAFARRTNPETGEPLFPDATALFDSFLSTNVPADEEGHYTIVDGAGYLYSAEAPDLFDDPQFLTSWDVERPTRWTTWTDVAGVGEVRSLAVPVVVDGALGGVFVVASFPADDYHEVSQLVRVLSIAGMAVVGLTTAIAWSITGRVLRPVRDLTTTARQITETDLSARIPVDGRDELAELGTTFNEMVGRLEQGFADQRRFLDDVAHELRTPITIVRGHLEMMGDDPADRAETIELVTDELDRMGRYVSDLLVLAKAEQPDFTALEPVDLGELALDIQLRVSALADRSWVIDAAPPQGRVAVLADPARLTQAMINLADNAVGHTGDGDEIGIGVSVADGTVRLSVRDTGSGVDPAIAETLFDRHARGASSRARRTEGVGIGLTIVDAIARAHGGSVSMHSRRGQGATFVITFPARTHLPPPHVDDAAPRADKEGTL
jgi:signal transduction histidine kinase